MSKSVRLTVAVATLFAAACASSATTTQQTPATTAPVASSSSSAAGETSATPTEAATTTTPTPSAAVTVNVRDGAKEVPVDTLLSVQVANGTIDKVRVDSTASGKNAVKVTGALDAQGTWVADTRLDPSSSYTVTTTATDAQGASSTTTTRFMTMALTRQQEVFPTLTPVIGGPFGVGQPVVVQFDLPVKNKAAFEKAMTVTSVPAQEGSWGWYGDQTVHWRPKTWWKPGTKVHLDANLNGVNAGNGTYGQLNRTLDLTIGRDQRGVVNIGKHTITWTTAGRKPVTYPMSAGKPGFTTRSGMKLVMEKAENITMASETTGIARNSSEGYEVHVAYALRVTSSGEFIHSAPWNAGNFGVRNASHGCVGMANDTMYDLYSTAQVGDPVKFVGSGRELEVGNGWTDWDMTWTQWKARSALK